MEGSSRLIMDEAIMSLSCFVMDYVVFNFKNYQWITFFMGYRGSFIRCECCVLQDFKAFGR